jgi:hypothetical protein
MAGERMLRGATVVVLPRRIGEGLGIFHVGGGRGMLWFTEIDTVIFDAALLLALFSVASRFRLALRDPLTWLTLLITLLIGIPLVYVVSNFGTLFRLREDLHRSCPDAVGSSDGALARLRSRIDAWSR